MENILIIGFIISLIFLFASLYSLKYTGRGIHEIDILIYLFLSVAFLGTAKYGEGIVGSVVLRFIVYSILLSLVIFIKGHIRLVRSDLFLFFRLSYPLLLFILYNFITALFIPNYWVWVVFKNGELFFDYIVSMLIFLFIGRRIESGNVLTVYYRFCIFLMLLIVVEAVLFPSAAKIPDTTSWGFRLGLVWPVATAGTVTMVGVLVLLLTLNKQRLRVIDGVLILSSMIVIILGGTRNKVIALLGGVVALILMGGKPRKYLIFGVLLIGGFVLSWGPRGILDAIYSGFVLRGSDVGVYTFSGRITTWDAVKPLFWQRPLLGSGYYASSRFLAPIDAPWMESVTLEGMWPNILVGSGVIGAIFVVGFILRFSIVVFKCIRKVPSFSREYEAVRGVLIIWIMLLIGSLSTDSFSFQSFESVSLGIIMAVLFVMYKNLYAVQRPRT